MKKLITFALLMMGAATMMAQQESSGNFFDMTKFFDDVKEFNATKTTSDVKWSTKIKELGHMDDEGRIRWQYVIPAKEPIDSEKFFTILANWQDRNFTDESAVKSKNENMVEFEWMSNQLAEVEGLFFETTIIHAIKNLKIELKPDRYRITGTIMHYRMLSTEHETKYLIPGECWPFANTKHKQSLSKAYINANADMINTMGTLVKSLEFYYNKVEEKVNTEEDW